MNKYIEEFREMLFKFQGNYPKHGKLFYMKKNELEELVVFIKKVCEKAQMNAPLAESLIDKKVQKYRNELLGIKEPSYYADGLASLTISGSSITAL